MGDRLTSGFSSRLLRGGATAAGSADLLASHYVNYKVIFILPASVVQHISEIYFLKKVCVIRIIYVFLQ